MNHWFYCVNKYLDSRHNVNDIHHIKYLLRDVNHQIQWESNNPCVIQKLIALKLRLETIRRDLLK